MFKKLNGESNHDDLIFMLEEESTADKTLIKGEVKSPIIAKTSLISNESLQTEQPLPPTSEDFSQSTPIFIIHDPKKDGWLPKADEETTAEDFQTLWKGIEQEGEERQPQYSGRPPNLRRRGSVL